MRIERVPGGGYRLTDGQDTFGLSASEYEDVYCALPIDNGTLYLLLTDSLPEASDRVALKRMMVRAGGMEPGMTRLQEAITALAPSAAAPPIEEESAAPPVLLPPAPPVAAPEEPEEPEAPPPPPKRAGSPFRHAPPAVAAARRSTPVESVTPDRSVLCVTADTRTATAVEAALRGSRFAVAAKVKDIEQALKQYVAQRADTVLLDLQVPGALEQTLGGGLNPIRQFLQADPNCRIVVTYTEEIKPLLAGAIRAGASAHVQLPYASGAVAEALSKALIARTVSAAPAALGIKRVLACSWKPADAGLLTAARSFIAQAVDLKGLEGRLDDKLREGEAVKLNLEIPGAKKPLTLAAMVASSKYDGALRKTTVRFRFTERSEEAVKRLRAFLEEAQPKLM